MIKSRADSFTRKLIGETLQKHTVSRILAHFPELSVQDVQSQKMSVRGEDILLTEEMPVAIIHDPKEKHLLAIVTLEDFLILKRLYAIAKGIL
mgnify:CR=1 FL=1